MLKHVFLFFSFLFFFLIFLLFLGLGPAQPIWAGLSPVGPAQSLAQASDPAGPQHAWTSFMRAQRCAKVINYLGTVPNALNKTTREKKTKKNRGSLPCCGLLRRSSSVSGGDRWWRSSLINQNLSFNLCLSALCFLCLRLKNCPVLCFSSSPNSLSVRFCFRSFRPVLVRGGSFSVWGFKKTQKCGWCLCVSGFFLLSLLCFFITLHQPLPLRCCSVYIGIDGLITGGRPMVGHH